jgi:hypothetical protein
MKLAMRRTYLLTLFLSIVLWAIHSYAQQARWLAFAPTVVELHGKLLKVVKYGPPSYGENPNSDVKHQIPMILLAQPVSAKGDAKSKLNEEDLLNVSFVQLIFLNTASTNYWRYEGQDIVVTGTLFRAETGHHYTQILMNVKAIRSKGK